MKQTKRILCVVLALALLAPVASAVDGNVLYVENKLPATKVTVFTGDTLKLEIDVQLFDGPVEQALEYRWYDYAYDGGIEQAPPIATGAKLEIPVTTKMIANASIYQTYSVAVIAGGVCIRTYTSKVSIIPSVRHLPSWFWDMILSVANGNTSVAVLTMVVMSPLSLALSVILIPLILAVRFLIWLE